MNKDVRRYRTATQWGVYDLEVGDNSIVGVTGIDADRFIFKVPTLRNVELTYPYFHDGAVWIL